MPWAMKPSWVPFSGEISGKTAVITPTPRNETEAITSTTNAAQKSAWPRSSVKNEATTKNSRTVRISP